MIFRWVTIFLLAWCAASCGAQSTNSAAHGRIVYRNSAYDFCITLPASWPGYSIVAEQWKGDWIADKPRPAPGLDLEGPKILIRNSSWTSAAPREDIPIMVFSLEQWKLIEAEQVSVSAAPIGPTELGRNQAYVFALPPRYDFDQREGVEEVVELMNHHPLKAPCPAAEAH
jgi:hypothetical protein